MTDLTCCCSYGDTQGRTLQPATLQVRPELVPAHISLATAEAVLFVGKAARVLQGTDSSAAGPGIGISPANSSLPAQVPTQASADALTALGSAAGVRAGEAASGCQHELDAPGTAQRLQHLAAQPQLDPLAFAACVNASHKQVSCSFSSSAGSSWLQQSSKRCSQCVKQASVREHVGSGSAVAVAGGPHAAGRAPGGAAEVLPAGRRRLLARLPRAGGDCVTSFMPMHQQLTRECSVKTALHSQASG